LKITSLLILRTAAHDRLRWEKGGRRRKKGKKRKEASSSSHMAKAGKERSDIRNREKDLMKELEAVGTKRVLEEDLVDYGIAGTRDSRDHHDKGEGEGQ